MHVLVKQTDVLYPNSHSSWNLTFTKFVPFRAIQLSDLSTPVYETPPSMYSAEGIMKILLNHNIPAERVCQKCPSFATCSSTFVIDVTSLAHCDVKKRTLGNGNTRALILSHFMCGFGMTVRLGLSDAKKEEGKVKYSTYDDSTVPIHQITR